LGRESYDQYVAIQQFRNELQSVQHTTDAKSGDWLWRLLGDEWTGHVNRLKLIGNNEVHVDLSRLSVLKKLRALDLGHLPSPILPPSTFSQLNQLTSILLVNEPALREDAALWCARVAEAPALKSLHLRGLCVSESDVRELAKCKSLRTLLLTNCELSESAVLNLASIVELQELRIDATISDDAAEYFARMPQLKALSFDGSMLTEKGLKALQATRNLTRLTIFNARFTRQVQADLEQERPDIKLDMSARRY
jgi:hypothetical protein